MILVISHCNLKMKALAGGPEAKKKKFFLLFLEDYGRLGKTKPQKNIIIII